MSDGSTTPDFPPEPSGGAAPPPATPPYAAPAAFPSPPAGYPGAAPRPGEAPPPQGHGHPPYGYPPPSQGYGQPPAGYAAPPSPYGAPPRGPQDPRPKVVAILALVAGIVGLLLAFIPFVTFFSWLFLLAGLVLSLVALISRAQGGKGFAIGGLVTSIVGGIVALVVSLLSVLIVGASSWPPSSVEPSPPAVAEPRDDAEQAPALTPAEDLVVTETAFGRQSYDETAWWYVVVMDNPNADYVFEFADITVEALGADGTILDSDDAYLTILPGAFAITGTFFSVGQNEIASLDVLGPYASEATRSPADVTGSFAIDGITAANDDYSTTVHGTVAGAFEQEQANVEVTVVARAPDGSIRGGDRTFIDRLPADGTKVQFEVRFAGPLPADTVYEGYAGL